MVPFWKQFAASATGSEHNVFFRARLKLTGLYVLIVAVIVCGFSLFLYQNLSHDLQNADKDDFADVQSHQHFATQALGSLQNNIFLADLIILFSAAALSYALAGWTLKPAQQSAEAQQAFAGNASHELRTPLAVMINDAEVLLRSKAPNKEIMRATLESNLEELRHMSHIVESLLLLARSGNQTKLALKKIDLENLLSAVAAKVARLAEQSGIALTVSCVGPIHIKGDAASLERAILNVIHNSFKHTPPGGSIRIDLKTENNHAIVRINDTGAGIEPRDLPRIFEKFYKGTGIENENGAGLGLTIVKEIIENHDGSISIESSPGNGTSVSIQLPRG